MEFAFEFGKQLIKTFGDLSSFLFEHSVGELVQLYLDGDGILSDIYNIISWIIPSIGSFSLFELLAGSGLIFLLVFSVIRFFVSVVP